MHRIIGLRVEKGKNGNKEVIQPSSRWVIHLSTVLSESHLSPLPCIKNPGSHTYQCDLGWAPSSSSRRGMNDDICVLLVEECMCLLEVVEEQLSDDEHRCNK